MKGYRTLTFNGLGAVLLLVTEMFVEVGTAPELHAILSEDLSKYVLLGVLFGNIVLRIATTTPVGHK